MKKNEVRKVIQKLLTDRRVKFYPQKGAGPDFLLEGGGAVEVKGKNFDLKKGLEQFIRYPLTYPKLEVAFPTNALDIRTLYVLHIIEKSFKATNRPSIQVYLVAKVDENKYKVRVYASSEDLFNSVTSKLAQKLYIPFDAKLEDSICKNRNIMINLNEEIRNILEEEAKSIMGYEVVL